ncbi:DUF1295 domain-containing protein [Actinomadura luteofluorescens]|uniref:Steroid 5-alpha reductase family enzyme n=1 Tax=Actinomadura luteofluorescens TaxID=46163 RepID=A0A7Y9EQD0_9ACTN|nr:DUF1295 domain-containing protein [Actinomadura luteofluorescens]NYD52004.1 steroid 5-alpha reductase family enzyme [Actinomadura luteofluorescens]
MTFWWSLACTAAAVAAVLAVTFAVASRLGRHSVIDVAWGLGFCAVAAVGAGVSAGHGDAARRWTVLAMTLAWGLRLAAHIAHRARGGGEDPRYEDLLSKAPGSRNLYALRKVYLPQGVVLWFVSLPIQVAMFQNGAPGIALYAGVVVWAIGLAFEAIGDFQLSRFAAAPANKGRVMDRGLWRYTRHPNYFGDALVWWGLFLTTCDEWTGPLTVLSPVAMTLLLAKGTGKPLLETRMARTRPGYADYAARTSGFIPLPPQPKRQ